MIIKYTIEKIVALMLIALLAPLFLVISLAVFISMNNGPIFFKQIRVGLNAKYFVIYKFRTMVINHNNSSISIRGEKRITKVGAILRRTKLDELPELVNILKGDMSFVGPRPDVPGYADNLTGKERQLLSIKPGLTGPASLKYRNEEQLLAMQSDPIKFNNEILFPAKVRINLNYIKHRSLLLDLKIIIYTILSKDLEEDYFNENV